MRDLLFQGAGDNRLVFDSEPRLIGRQVTATLSPLPESKRVLKFNHPDYEYEDEDDSAETEEIGDETDAV